MSATLTTRPALDFDLNFLADLFNRSFEGYFVEVAESPQGLSTRLRFDSIDLALSRVAMRDDEPVGIVYVAVRGYGTRIAGMGVVKSARRQGVGKRLMRSVIARTRALGMRYMILEVIEANTAAHQLYRGLGFEDQRRLVGYHLADASALGQADTDLEPVDGLEIARHVTRSVDAPLPWQLDGETLAAYGPPVRGWGLAGKAFAMIQEPAEGAIILHAVIVPESQRRQSHASRLLRALIAEHGNRPWRIPARVPEGLAVDFLSHLGFRQDDISQQEMRLAL